MPADLMSRAQRLESCVVQRFNSSGVMTTGSTPLRRSLIYRVRGEKGNLQGETHSIVSCR
jgi:hypothetical protein